MPKYPVARAGIGVMIHNNGKVLLGLRNEDPEKASSQLHGEGTWTFPGGKVDFQETLEQAAKREVLEETNLKLNKIDVMSITDEIVHDAHFVTVGFICENFEGELKTMEPDEIIEWKWFDLNNLPEKIFKPTEKMIKNFRENKLY